MIPNLKGSRILWVGNAPGIIGGQNRVAYHTITELQRLGYEVGVCGKGVMALPEGFAPPVQFCEPYDEYKPETFDRAVQLFKPTTIIFSHDCWLFGSMPQWKSRYPDTLFIGWFTIDGAPLHYSWIPIFRAVDQLLVSTQFGKEVIYAGFPEKPVFVVEYGVTHQLYYPPTAERKEQLYDKFSEALGVSLRGKTIFFFNGNNQNKKNIAAMIHGFQINENPDTILILALKSYPVQMVHHRYDGEIDLHGLLVDPRVILISEMLDHLTIRDLYQLSDFYLYPSQGEAPGLQVSEAQLCGCIPIVTNYTELPRESCYPELILPYTEFHGAFNVVRAIVTKEAIRDAIYKACASKALLSSPERKMQVVRKFENRTWTATAYNLHKIIQAAMEGSVLLDPEVQPL